MVTEADTSPQRLARLASSTLSISPLRDAFEATRDQDVKIHIARLLCYLGDATGAPFLIKVIEEQVRDGLPRAQTPTLALPPEHGWAPEPVFSLYAVGLAKAGREVVGLMESIAHLIKDSPDVFQSREDSPFEYVRVICAVAERNPSSEMVRPLEVLYRNTCLRKLSIPRDGDPRFTVDPALDRQAYLELCLGRALARCADRRGYDILLRYAEDIRGSFARSASDELAELLGGPLPNDYTARQRLVSRQVAMAVQIPLNRTID